ncbi:MAG: rod shape-determining protein MreC [Terriglobales bacterium]
MESVFGRYRNLIVLVGVLFAQILGLAVQVKRAKDRDSEPTRLIRIWAVGAVTPLEKALSWAQASSGAVWHNYFYLRGVRAENRELKQQIEQMRIEQARITQDADQAHRLQALLGFKEQFISKTVAAQVIGGTGSELSRSVYIDKGERDGIRPDMAVLTRDGIVGKVLRVYHSTSLVLLIDDQTSGVGSILEKSRLQGILRGTPSGAVVLEKVMSDENVPVGEQVLTSGGDGIFPKGLNVGTVTKVSTGSDLFLNIHVRPAADLNRLEEVLVVTKVDEKQTEPEHGISMRAADILAERLPGVPPKPEATVAAGQSPAARKPANLNSGSEATPKATKPNSASTPGSPDVQSKSKPPSTVPLPIHAGTAQSNSVAAKKNSGVARVSVTSAQSGSANLQKTVVQKNHAAVPTSTVGNAGTGSPAAKSSNAGTPAGDTTRKPPPKPVVPKAHAPNDASTPPKTQPVTEDTPQ